MGNISIHMEEYIYIAYGTVHSIDYTVKVQYGPYCMGRNLSRNRICAITSSFKTLRSLLVTPC